jgi:hypothetical protein
MFVEHPLKDKSDIVTNESLPMLAVANQHEHCFYVRRGIYHEIEHEINACQSLFNSSNRDEIKLIKSFILKASDGERCINKITNRQTQEQSKEKVCTTVVAINSRYLVTYGCT